MTTKMNLDATKLKIIVGGLLVLGVVVYFAQSYTEKKEQEGRSALYKIQKTFEDEAKAIPEADRASGVSMDVDAKFSKTVAEYKGLIAAKTGTDHTLFEASFKLGSLYFDHLQNKQAEEAFNQSLKFAGSAFQKASAYLMLGMVNERTQNFKGAIDVYTQAMAKGFDGLKPEFLLGLVRNHLKLNEKDKAKLFSEKLTHDHPGTKAATDAQDMVR